MTGVILVAAGGAAGSVARYALSMAGAAILGGKFPAGTLAANLLGCLAIGVLMFFIVERDQPSVSLRLLIITGFLGGLTTFSSFGYETVHLLRQGDVGKALLNVGANVILGLAAVWAGFSITRQFA